MAEFEIIEDVSKALPKGKDLKKFTPFIIGGLVLGLGALIFKRRSPAVPQQGITDESSVGSDVDLGGIMTDFANQTNQAIQQNNQEMSYQLSEVAGNLFDVIGEQNAVINQLQKDLQDQLDKVSQPQSVPVYQQASITQNWSAAPTSQDSGSSIYFDGVDDDIQFNNVVQNVQKAVSRRSISRSEGDRIKKEIAGLGNDGVGWTAESQKLANERMNNDPTIRQTEIERTLSVIQNRKQQGLSTQRQTDHLRRLQTNDWTK